MSEELKEHWEHVYITKQPHEVSWTQDVPQTSLDFIHSFNVSKDASIIDIGGGDSKLVDFLLEEGYENLTVLDISEAALNRSKERLGDKASKVKWIVSDISEFTTTNQYDIWHDRAAFHFLTAHNQIQKYVSTARNAVKGYAVIGTFSENGPKKCSGLDIKQYSEAELQDELSKGFVKIKCIREDHLTPFDTKQNFLFCSFKKKDA
jgi:cyclopropane fatty-acyl-phospholipid synthase-like methyltransferase